MADRLTEQHSNKTILKAHPVVGRTDRAAKATKVAKAVADMADKPRKASGRNAGRREARVAAAIVIFGNATSASADATAVEAVVGIGSRRAEMCSRVNSIRHSRRPRVTRQFSANFRILRASTISRRSKLRRGKFLQGAASRFI